MDPVVFLNDIINENLDRLIVSRLEQDLEMVEGQDAELAAALRRVIRFLQQPDYEMTNEEALAFSDTSQPNRPKIRVKQLPSRR